MTESTPALKRRYVFRVMAVCGIVGFPVLQVVDLAVPGVEFGTPPRLVEARLMLIYA